MATDVLGPVMSHDYQAQFPQWSAIQASVLTSTPASADPERVFSLFVLAELAESVQKTVHVKGRSSALGKADLTAQNAQMLRRFDAKGNALYHRQCVMILFKLSNNRYTCLHQLAQTEHKIALIHRHEVSPAKVELGRVVIPGDAILPDGPLALFAKLRPNDAVELRRRRGHGLEGRASNRAYGPKVVSDFRDFVNANSAPNARREGKGHTTFYFWSEFTLIEPMQDATKPPSAGYYYCCDGREPYRGVQYGAAHGRQTWHLWCDVSLVDEAPVTDARNSSTQIGLR
jgi:hypothetical protein